MNFKDILGIAKLLITSPTKAWEKVSHEPEDYVLMGFVYPMVSIVALVVLVSKLISYGILSHQTYEKALLHCISTSVGLFATFFSVSYILWHVLIKRKYPRITLKKVQQYIGYSMSLMFSLAIICSVFPFFAFMGILFMLYTLYILWKGTEILLKLEEEDKVSITFIAFLLLSIISIVAERFLNFLMRS